MGVSLSWNVTVTNTSNTAATVKVVLKAKSTSGSYNAGSPSGYIKIDGTKYTFSHSFSANTTTTLATKSKSVTRTTANRNVSIEAKFYTDVSSGTVSKSGTAAISARPHYTVTFNGNGGATTTKTVYYGYTTTFPSVTRTGYVFNKWNGKYAAGATTPTITGNTTYTAYWTPATYTVSFNANGGTAGTKTSLTRTYNTAMSITDEVTPTRQYYDFLGWADLSTATTAQYTNTYPASTSTSTITLYAVWKQAFTPPAFTADAIVPKRWKNGAADQDALNVYIPVAWTNGKNADGTTAQVTSVTYEYKETDETTWTTLTTHTISSGTTDSLTTTGDQFTISQSYDIRITLTDSNSSVQYISFVSKSSFIWKAIPASNGGGFLLGVNLYFSLDTTATSGTDYDIYDAIQTMSWDSDVVV